MSAYFSADYASARLRFREAVAKSRSRLDVMPLDAKGPQGEDLSIDAAWFGNASPDRLMIHSSGLHGVEGFAGSAIQLQLLESLPSVPADTALVVVHCLNPFGMAWLRRSNENNVDLNRNFLEGEPYSGAPEGYVRLNRLLNPASPPRRDLFLLKTAVLVARYGMAPLRQAVAGGQYEFPRGLFFGGKGLEQGPRRYREYLAEHLKRARRVLVVDVHTGLGRYAEDTILVDPGKLEQMRHVYGEHVAPLEPESGPAYRVRGGLYGMFAGIRPQAGVDFIGQEFGTYSSVKVLRALRAENRWHHYGGGSVDHVTKRELRDAFNPRDPRWQAAVLHRGKAVFEQAWRELSAQ